MTKIDSKHFINLNNKINIIKLKFWTFTQNIKLIIFSMISIN